MSEVPRFKEKSLTEEPRFGDLYYFSWTYNYVQTDGWNMATPTMDM